MLTAVTLGRRKNTRSRPRMRRVGRGVWSGQSTGLGESVALGAPTGADYASTMRPIRWLSVVVPVIAVAIIELVSDGLLDAELPFPMDTIVVVVVVAILAWGFSTIALRRIEQLSAALRARNVDLERRAASARALHRVSVAIAALAELDEILRAIVDQARALLDVDVAVLVTNGADGEAHVAASSGPDGSVDRAGGFPEDGAGVSQVRPAGPRQGASRGAAPARGRDDRVPDRRFGAEPRVRGRRSRDALVAGQPGRHRDRERPAPGPSPRAGGGRRA